MFPVCLRASRFESGQLHTRRFQWLAPSAGFPSGHDRWGGYTPKER